MIRRKQQRSAQSSRKERPQSGPEKNRDRLLKALEWVVPNDDIFADCRFHGNILWRPQQLAIQALCFSWQETRNVTDGFDQALDACEELGLERVAKTYPAFMESLHRYEDSLGTSLNRRLQRLQEEVGGRFWRRQGWVLIGFDGSRASAPRTASNERAFCAPNYGNGVTAKYRQKKSKGMRRKQNQRSKPQPQEPQVWITMMWHMGLRLPWSWRLGPSNSSERRHVEEMLEQEEIPENTLFCGDAGFVGYPLWSKILATQSDFLVRVGANVSLLSKHADIKRLSDGIVLCWPKGQMDSGAPPLKLRLVKIKVGRTVMWMLTSVLDRKRLSKKQIVKYYKARWGIEVEFRGLKQTLDNRKLRCRNSDRLLAELNWSIRAMAVAELLALREQLEARKAKEGEASAYDPQERSLAKTMRALRTCMRKMRQSPKPADSLDAQLARAVVQNYNQRADKRARYRPPNPDKKPLGEPKIRALNAEERAKLNQLDTKLTV